jgi:two-component system response regulator VanR
MVLLIVEDDKLAMKNLVDYFEDTTMKVVYAESAEEGYQKYLDYEPSIIFTDVELPKTSGLDMLKKIRENDMQTKAIVMTGYRNEEYLLTSAELKLTRFIYKPFTLQKISEALEASIEEINKFRIERVEITPIETDLYWDHLKGELFYNRRIVKLTSTERTLLKFFMDNPNEALSNESILESVWGITSAESTGILRSTIRNLRQKLPEGVIDNVYGYGYKFQSLVK